MTENRWVSGFSHYELADEWDVSTSAVAQDASEAARILRICKLDHADIRAMLMSQVEHIKAKSMERARYKEALEAIRIMQGLHKEDAEAALEGKPTVASIQWEGIPARDNPAQ